MLIFLAGVILFVGTHGFVTFLRGPRNSMVQAMGAGPFKALVSVESLVGLGLIIWGWSSNWGTDQLYQPPEWGRHASALLMLVALALLMASFHQNNLKRLVHHPMMASMAVWGLAHLLSNGEVRSVILFASIGIYGALAYAAASARGEWVDPGPFERKFDFIWLASSLGTFAIVSGVHIWLLGRNIFTG